MDAAIIPAAIVPSQSRGKPHVWRLTYPSERRADIMSLRLRLIVAFFLFSVVPLAAVTFYSYISNERALRVAAQHETEMLTGELTQRMQVVTTQVSERVERLMDMPVAASTATGTSGRRRRPRPRTVVARSTPATGPAVHRAGAADRACATRAVVCGRCDQRDRGTGRRRARRGRDAAQQRRGARTRTIRRPAWRPSWWSQDPVTAGGRGGTARRAPPRRKPRCAR